MAYHFWIGIIVHVFVVDRISLSDWNVVMALWSMRFLYRIGSVVCKHK